MFTIQKSEAYHALLATENEQNLSTRLIYSAITLRKKILIIVICFKIRTYEYKHTKEQCWFVFPLIFELFADCRDFIQHIVLSQQ